jgi:hypothetical protein
MVGPTHKHLAIGSLNGGLFQPLLNPCFSQTVRANSPDSVGQRGYGGPRSVTPTYLHGGLYTNPYSHVPSLLVSLTANADSQGRCVSFRLSPPPNSRGLTHIYSGLKHSSQVLATTGASVMRPHLTLRISPPHLAWPSDECVHYASLAAHVDFKGWLDPVLPGEKRAARCDSQADSSEPLAGLAEWGESGDCRGLRLSA